MRVGHNPLSRELAEPRRDVIMSAITHLPNTDGYHAHRLKVIKLSLVSMRENPGRKAHVAIWDNGSCKEFTDWLQNEYKPDTLVLSKNVGKSVARKSIFRMFNPASTIAMADDDILYYPNWLAIQIELLNSFPNVSAVSGNAIRTSFRWGCQNTINWAKENAELLVGHFLSEQRERDFAVSIGRNPDEHIALIKNDLDYKVKYKGIEAFCTAHHCQFVAKAGKVEPVMQWDDAAMADEKPFDIALDQIGLRLATMYRLTRHIGNVIDDEIQKEAEMLGFSEVTDDG